MGVKISQEVVEIVHLPSPAGFVSQVVLEVVRANSYSTPGAVTGAAISQVVAEVVHLPDPKVAVSQVVAEVVYRDADAIPYVVSHPVWID